MLDHKLEVSIDLDSESGLDASAADGPADRSPGDELVEADLLVEDVSIDGMCGVY